MFRSIRNKLGTKFMDWRFSSTYKKLGGKLFQSRGNPTIPYLFFDRGKKDTFVVWIGRREVVVGLTGALEGGWQAATLG